jgi:hypothetical protein
MGPALLWWEAAEGDGDGEALVEAGTVDDGDGDGEALVEAGTVDDGDGDGKVDVRVGTGPAEESGDAPASAAISAAVVSNTLVFCREEG